jgi:ankyrin repeat protein
MYMDQEDRGRFRGDVSRLPFVDAGAIEDTVRLLIDHGADVAAQDETHSTPLHLAALLGNTKAARLLIEHGADVAARDVNHRTPLHLASSSWVGVGTILLI